jgi:sugar lactone lactonase YvrE
VYIADSFNNAIKELPSGCFSASCVITLGGGFSFPQGVAVDENGNVFVADYENQAVKEMPPGCVSSNCVTTVGGRIRAPESVAVDGLGNVYVAENYTALVQEIPSGCTSSTCVLTLDGGFIGPVGVALDGNGNLYVADVSNNSIDEMPTGCASPSCVITLGGGFYEPMGVAVDQNGNVFVADSFNSAVKEMPAGCASSSCVTTLDGGFYYPYGVAVDESGNIYIADTANNAVKEIFSAGGKFGSVNVGSASTVSVSLYFKFDTGGTLGSTVVLTQGATGLDFTDAGGDTCTASSAYNAGDTCAVNVTFKPTAPGQRYGAVELLDSTGNLLATGYVQGTGVGSQINFAPGSQSTILDSGEFPYAPFGVAVDGSGNVFFADYSNSAVEEIVAAGGYSTVKTLGSGFNLPWDVAVDGSGNIFVADYYNSAVKEILAAGGYTTVTTLGSGFSYPRGIAVDGNGNLFVADTGNNAVKEIPAAGGYTAVNVLGSGFNAPFGVAVDGSGNVFVSDAGNNEIKEIEESGGYTTVKTLMSGFNNPDGLAVDGNGNIFVADFGNSAVKEILASSGYTTVNTLDGDFYRPRGVGVGGSGNVYVADSGNFRVEKLDYADPPSFSFPTATLAGSADTIDGPQSQTVENIGNATLTAAAPGLTAPADFTQVAGSGTPPDCTASFSLAAGASCNLSIEFAPTTTGTLTESFVLTDNSLNVASATQSISLSGTGETIGTATTLASSLNPTSYGQPVTITATVTPASGSTVPTGTVLFSLDGSPVGSAVTLNSGTAVFTSSTLVAGTHNITAAFTPATGSGFTASSSVALSQVVNEALPTVGFTGAPASAPYESTFTVATTTNASTTAIVTASGSCSITGSTVTITAPSGTCSLTATWAADNNYLAASASQSTTATQAMPVITWAAPAAITYGTGLSGTQLDATATYNGTAVAGTFVYTPSKGTVLTAGEQTLSVTFTPNKPVDFTSANASVTLQVNQATPKITWAKPASIVYGTALRGAQLDATASVPGAFVYSPAAGIVLDAGTQSLSATFAPTDTVDYLTVTDTVTFSVTKAASTVSWGVPAAITYGTPLSSAQLDTTASVPGTFVYTPTLGAVEPGGADKLSVTFTPMDTVDYSTITTSVMLQVNPSTPTINWTTPAAIAYGTALTATQLNATATYNGSSVPGTFTYTPAKGAVLGAGSQALSVSFTPNNTTNYLGGSASVTLQVNPATPKIAWARPAAIVYGTALSAAQLDATSSVPGTFVYSPAVGAILNAGTQSLSVTFTPTDTVDYLTAADVVTITVNQTTSTSTITSNTPNPSVVGQPVTVGFSVTGSGVPTGTVSVTASTGENCSGPLSGGVGSCSLTFTASGSPRLTATYPGDINFKASTSAKVTQTVSP